MPDFDAKATTDRIITEEHDRANRTETDGQNWLTVDIENGTVSRSGIDQPEAKLVKIERYVLTIKVPGHSYWVGLYMPRGYAPSAFQVYSILEKTNEGDGILTLRVRELTSFPVRS